MNESNMAQLATLQSGLNRVKRFRTSVRLGSAWSVVLSALLWALLSASLLDVAMRMGKLERVIVLFGVVGFVVWLVKKYLLPAMQVRDEMIALALMVERQQGIGSDLVAALQFSDRKRNQYGSGDLRQAVVDYTDEVSEGLDYLDGFDKRQLHQRLIVLVATILFVVTPVIAWPGHAQAFVNRFFLGGAHYPTNTKIIEIQSPSDRAPYGQPVVFQVLVGGELPNKGRVELRASSSGLRTTIALEPDDGNKSLFVGRLDRALDDLTYTIYLGDAYTEDKELVLIPLPVVEVDMQVQTPSYATKRFDKGDAGRYRRALEGSRVVPIVKSDKRLKQVQMTINDESFAMELVGDHYTIQGNDPQLNPLAYVTEDVRYEVQVVDEDDLKLDRAISGVLQVRADEPPRVAAATATRYVVANAAPAIKYKAIDYYALDRVVVKISVFRKDGVASPVLPDAANNGESGTSSTNNTDLQEDGKNNASLESAGGKAGETIGADKSVIRVVAEIKGKKRQLSDTIKVDLAELKLVIGDRVEVMVEAYDFRGEVPGKAGQSERMVFQVTDKLGVIKAMGELNSQMDKKLDQIIEAQLGGSK